MIEQARRKRSLVGIDLVRLLAAEGDRVFSTERARQLGPRVGLKAPYLLEALHHLRHDGWIEPIRRGLYAISSSVPGVAAPREFEIAMALADPAAISHWSALHHHGLTDQAPRKIFVLTTTASSIPRSRRAGSSRAGDGYAVGRTVYKFVQVRPERYFGTQKVWVGEARVVITDPERTLLDGLSMPHYCGDFSEVLHAFEVRGVRLDLDRIVRYALRLDAAVAKRLGWVLERQGVKLSRLARLAALPISGYRRLDPDGPRAGGYNRRWRIQENLPGQVSA